MIGRLEGRLHQLEPGIFLVDVGGVGYLVHTPLRGVDTLDPDQRGAFWIHTVVRDDAIILYGFPERPDLEAFRRLIAVAGVGPKTALAVLSGLNVDELSEAVELGDARRLQRAPGVGKKTADRIILELKGRLGNAQAAGLSPDDPVADAISALVNLGYSEREAGRAVRDARLQGPNSELGELLRLALQILTP